MSAFRAAADSTIDVDKVPFCPAGFRIAAIDTARNSAAILTVLPETLAVTELLPARLPVSPETLSLTA